MQSFLPAIKAFDEITPDEGFLSVIVSAIPSGVFVTDMDHNILLINKAAAELAGRSQGDCFDRKCHEVFNTILCKTDSCLCRAARQGKSIEHGTCVMRRNGKEIPIEYASKPIRNIAGKVIGCVAHIMDIADRLEKERTITEQHEMVLRLLREKSAHNAKLGRANRELFQLGQDLEALAQERTITEMALQIADQIRNPATAIGGLSRILLKELPHDTVQAERFQTIVQEVKKLEDRVQNFEKLALEQRRLFSREDLRNIVTQVLSVWTLPPSAPRNVKMQVSAPREAVMATVNRRTLKTALLDVLRNAVHVSPEDGIVQITTTAENGRPMIIVKDQGKGRLRKTAAKLLTAPKAAVGPADLGHGLMLAQQILDEHQGHIEIRSAKGEGTTVCLCLPSHWEEKRFQKRSSGQLSAAHHAESWSESSTPRAS